MDVGVRIKDEEMLKNMKAYTACINRLWTNLEGDNDLFYRFINSNPTNQKIFHKEYENIKNSVLGGGLSYENFLNNPNHK